MKHEVYVLLGKRFVFINRCAVDEAQALCQRYERMGTVAAHMPCEGGTVHWFPANKPANSPRFIGAVT